MKTLFTFFYPVLEALNKGSLIRRVIAVLFGLIGFVILFGAFYIFFNWVEDIQDFWSVLIMILFLLTSYIVFQAWFYRAKEIFLLEDSRFTVIPIVSNLFRVVGETIFIFSIFSGIGGVILI